MSNPRDILGEPRQLGFVVGSVNDAVQQWSEGLGVGPFFVADRFELADFRHLGRPAPIAMKLALGSLGALQIELIEVLSDGPSDFHDFQRSSGEGLHHLGFWSNNFGRDDAAMRALGYEELHAGTTPGLGEPFVYYRSGAHLGTVIELTQADGAKGLLFADIDRAAREWDGTDPVRSLSAALAAATAAYASRSE